MRCHSSGHPQQQRLTPTEAGGITVRQKKKPKAFLISGLAQELPSNVGVSLSSVPRSSSRASCWSSVGLLLEPVAVTPGMPASSRGEEQSKAQRWLVSAGPCMAALVPGALPLPVLLCWDRRLLSCLCV